MLMSALIAIGTPLIMVGLTLRYLHRDNVLLAAANKSFEAFFDWKTMNEAAIGSEYEKEKRLVEQAIGDRLGYLRFHCYWKPRSQFDNDQVIRYLRGFAKPIQDV